jgi:hypothetical protein
VQLVQPEEELVLQPQALERESRQREMEPLELLQKHPHYLQSQQALRRLQQSDLRRQRS